MTERYSIILADPPWHHSSTAGAGKGARRAAAQNYAGGTMPTSDIVGLDRFVNTHAATIARLFLWVPDSMLPDGLLVMNGWGFQFVKVAFVWVKLGAKPLKVRELHEHTRPDETVWTHRYRDRRLVFGAGRTTRNGAELCLLGSRGRMDVKDHSQRQVILAPQREHSHKPDEQYERIEAMYPDATYLELFARPHNRRARWAAWGDELEPAAGE